MVTLHLSHYRSGSAGMLVNIDDRGQTLGTADLREGLQSLSVNDGELLALRTGTMTLYDASLDVRKSYDCPAGVRQALLRDDGEALLLTGYGAELYRL